MKNISRKTIEKAAKEKNMNPLAMSDAVYALRRRVINCIYDLKKVYPELPRLDIRIVEDHERTLAYAHVGTPVMRVSVRAVTASDFDLYTIVAHEAIHCLGMSGHDEKCPLMKAVHEPLPRDTVNKLFKKYAKKLGRKGLESLAAS